MDNNIDPALQGPVTDDKLQDRMDESLSASFEVTGLDAQYFTDLHRRHRHWSLGHPVFGHSCGPIIDHNPGWKPTGWLELTGGKLKSSAEVTAKHIQHDVDNGLIPNGLTKFNKMNFGLCPAADENNVMCGIKVSQQNTLRRHFRRLHTGCFQPCDSRMTSDAERLAGIENIRMFVLQGGWRGVVIKIDNDPGAGKGVAMYEIAEKLEEIASNPEFARLFGTVFHRQEVDKTKINQKKNKRSARKPLDPGKKKRATRKSCGGSDNKQLGGSKKEDSDQVKDYVNDARRHLQG
ncbi:hypothetical protein N7495_001886 [Penicillium taxi]|uniref:uncharacterized protein n=1 Tax=Penicillium taxi TaxID=168475 RepID=UPI002544EB58|nr:uncharacterized protein N7495_001886 [Penicillium taxi]KAJ5909204.1 hypothetical protein N7495_001886 [Penicillium taxi]